MLLPSANPRSCRTTPSSRRRRAHDRTSRAALGTTPTTPAGAAAAYDDVDDRKAEECVAAVPPTDAASGRTPTPSSCYLALPSVHLAHDVFDGMPERPVEPIGFPEVEEASQKIKYGYGNYDDYLHTVCECAGLDLEGKSIHEGRVALLRLRMPVVKIEDEDLKP